MDGFQCMYLTLTFLKNSVRDGAPEKFPYAGKPILLGYKY